MKTFMYGAPAETPPGYQHFLQLYEELDPILHWPAYTTGLKPKHGPYGRMDVLEFTAWANARVNITGTYRREGVDKWTGLLPSWEHGKLRQIGDCEDFAISKLVKMVANGVPRGALRLATCRLGGEGHAVLLAFVQGPKNPLVLDQRFETPLEFHKAPHEWIGVENFREVKQPDDEVVRWRSFGRTLAGITGLE